MTTSRTAQLANWLENDAYPLWRDIGVDHATGTVWEELDHGGRPCADMQRRLRVQARQAYCFALSQDPQHLSLAHQLFRFVMDKGFDRTTGNLAARLNPDTTIATAPHDLYDLAFVLLAAAALIESGVDVAPDLARLEDDLARLKAPRGWYENAAHDRPRRQNPHMHLFEAMTALYRATGAKRFRSHAQECLDLFCDVFLQPDGHVLELFDDDWSALTADAQAVEPGHMAEWIYLLDRFQNATGAASGVNMAQMFDSALAYRDEMGLLPDRALPASVTRRLWPQTELLKSALVMHRQGGNTDLSAHPDAVLAAMWREYLDTPLPGGWYDKRSQEGALLSDTMPASTFYHIVVAFHFYMTIEPAA